MKQQEINLIKSFTALQENISGEKKRLYDKYHELELSHNRKIRALKKIRDWASNTENTLIQTICNNALFSNGREKGI